MVTLESLLTLINSGFFFFLGFRVKSYTLLCHICYKLINVITRKIKGGNLMSYLATSL